MAGSLTEVTELATALGMLDRPLERAMRGRRPSELRFVSDNVWRALRSAWDDERYGDSFRTAFANGRAFGRADDGLRGRPPRLVEWRGPHRPPGDDTIPADLRIDHVYLVSCKYLSKVLLNPGPSRLFERLLQGEGRSAENWFAVTAPDAFQELYDVAVECSGVAGLPSLVGALDRPQQLQLKAALAARTMPEPLRQPWAALCRQVADGSAARWAAALVQPRDQLRLLWKMLRITSATYFVLGADRGSHLRLRVVSAWDWMQTYELRSFSVAPRAAGQPEVGWLAVVRPRSGAPDLHVAGHVEIRWSHGRFVGVPESKVYLDTPYSEVPGYEPLVEPAAQLQFPVDP
ncbi:MAG: hypothetical protein JJE52_15295 [Acidimicrobiia bacterium]|nr:hypothetical protein [Acidimicrobiia bacterium]